jgi:hypothetical protein
MKKKKTERQESGKIPFFWTVLESIRCYFSDDKILLEMIAKKKGEERIYFYISKSLYQRLYQRNK